MLAFQFRRAPLGADRNFFSPKGYCHLVPGHGSFRPPREASSEIGWKNVSQNITAAETNCWRKGINENSFVNQQRRSDESENFQLRHSFVLVPPQESRLLFE